MSKKKTGYFDWLTNKDNEGENTTSGGYFDWLNSEKGQSYVSESKIKKQKEHEYDKFVSKFNSEVEEYNKKVKNNEEKQKQLANDIAINMARFGAKDALNGKGNPYMNHAIDTSNLLYDQDEYRAAVGEIKKGKEYDQYLTDFPKISDYYNNDQLLRGYDSRKANGIKVMDDDIYNYVASAYDANKYDSSSEPVTIDDIAKEFNITYDQAEEYYTNFSNYIRRSEADLQDKANSAYRKDEEPAPTKVNAGYLPTAGVFNDVNDIDNREASLDWMHMPEKEDNSLLGSKYHTDEANSQYEYAKNAVQVWDSLPDDLKDKIDYAFGNNGANDEKIKENLLKYSGYSEEELESYNKISENYDKLQEAVDTYEFSEKVLGELSEEELTDLLDEVKESRKNKRGFGFRSEYLFPNKLKNKIAEKYGEDKAQDILDAADYIVGFSEKQELYEGFKDLLNSDNHLLSFAGAVGLHAADIAGSLTGGLGLIDTLGQKLRGSKIVNPYSVGHSYDVFSSALSQAQTETIDNPTWNFVFQTADSIAKSALMMAASSGASSALGLGENVAKGIGFVGFGANAFNQAYMECIESGMGTDTAIQVATANGIFEGLFEELSFDKLLSLKKVDASSRKQLFKNLLSSSAVEGSEEFFTTTADWLAEYAIASDLSKQETLKRQLIQQGMDPDEADKQVMKEFWKEAALAFAGGFVSGGVHAGGKMAFDSYRVNKLSNSILEEGTDSVEEIRQAALDLDHDTEAYKIASEKTADEMTTSDINSIIRGAMQSSATEGTIHDVLVEELSKTENISMEEAKEAVDGWIQGETAEEGKYQLSDEVAESILEENKSKTVGTTILNAAYKANSASEIKKDIAKAKKTDQKQLDRYVKNNGTIAAVDISSENEDEHKDVEIAKFIMVGKNNNIPVAVLANGDIMPLDSLAIKDENMAAVIQDVLTTENTYAVNTAREYYDGSIDTKNFSKAGIAFYNYGYAVAQGNKDITFDSIDVPALNQYRGIIQNDAYLNQMFSIGMNRANQELQAEEEKNEKKPEKKISRKENENAGKVTDKRNDGAGVDDQWNKLATAVAEATGLNIVLTDDIIGGKNTNGNFTAAFGRLTVNTTADYAYGTFIHELSEFGMSYNQKAMQQLVRSVLDFINTSKGSEYLNSALNDYKNAYRSTVESTKTFREAGDEYVFDVMAGVFMTESGMSDFYDFLYNNVSEEKRTGILQTLTDIFDFLVDKIKTFLGKTTNTSRKDGYKIALDKANELRNQWKNVIQGAIENYSSNNSVDGKYSESFSAEVEEERSIKQQLKDNSEKLNSMAVVGEINSDNINTSSAKDILQWVMDMLKPYGEKISVYNFGDVVLDRARINRSYDYLKPSNAEVVSYALIPRVLKRGIIIVDEHKHKNRNYNTVTFAAPIIIDGVRCNMAVVVRVEGKNYYKMHRVLLPDGKKLDLKKNKNPEFAPNKVKNNTSKTNSEFDSSVSDISQKSSSSVEVDSDGRKLSEEQKKYFAESKVVDENGNLLVMYHGTPMKGFSVFKVGSYFSPNKAVADIYQSASASSISSARTSRMKHEASTPGTYEVYLNIVNPFDTRNENERKIFEQFYREYGGTELQESGLPDWTDGEDLIEFLQENGYEYDGLILDEGGLGGYGDEVFDRGLSYVPFDAENQVKDINNLNPTENPDIHHSVEVTGKYADEKDSFEFNDNGSVIIKNSKDISSELWNEIAKQFKKIGYTDITNGKVAREIFSKWDEIGGYKCNPDQAEAIKSIFGIDDNAAVEEKDVVSIAKKAEKHFGTTTRFKLAGYLDVNGKLLDFSEGQGYRVQDHREISEVLELPDDAGYSDGLIEFMAEGNIRMQEYGIDIAVAPNAEQKKVLRSFFNSLDGEVTVDFSAINGNTIGSAEYIEGTSSSRILNDIENFFETGNVPEGTYDGNTYYSVEVDSIEGLKHSLNVPDGEADFWEKINSGEWEDNKWEDGSSTTNSNKYLSDAVSVLEEGAKVVGDVELDEKAINKMAREIKKYYMTTIDAKKIADSLTKVFSYMASTEDISYGTMLGIMKEIATPIIENSEDVSAETKELYDNVKSYLKANKISLSDEQKKEVAYTYGSYNNFRKSLIGTVTISKDGISLDSIWSELCGVAAGLDVSTVDAYQGIALAEYLESIKPIKTNPFNQNKEQAAYDCAMDIYRRYFEYQAENTAMAKAEAKLEPIKIGIVNAMKSYKESTRENYKKAVREEYLKAKEEKNAKLKRLAETLEQIESDQESAFSNMDELTAELLEAEKVKYQERIKKLREQNEENVAKVKAANKQSRENERYRRNNTELKQSVRSAVNSLNSMLTSPNVNNHIKKSLVRPVIDVLESINLDTGKSKTMQEKLAKLAQVYESYKSDKTFEIDYDENLKNRIDELSVMFADRNYTELSNDELSKVLDIVRALKKQIQNANRLIQNAKVKDAYEAARTVVDEVETSHGVNTKIGEVFNKYNTWQLNAYREFRKLSGYNDDSVLMSLYDEFQQGELKQLSFQREANQLFEEVMQGSENQKEMKRMLSTKEEDLVDVGLIDKKGNKVLVTRDMRMSLILHSLNQGNMNHVLGGGLTIPDMELYKKGKLTEAYTKGDTYRFVSYETALKYARANAKWAKDRSNQSLKAEADLARSEMEAEKQNAAARIDKLVNELSEWEKMYLEKAKVFFHEMTGKYINEVTEELRGYAVASVKNYFPIKTDPDFTRTEFAGLVMDASLEGWGNLKSRINAANPIMLEGLSNILLRQIDKTSNYIGYAIPVRDFNMITNKQFSDDRSGQTKNIRRSIKKTWSNYDYQFLERFMKDIQGGRSTDSTFIDMLRGNFAGATLTANIGVAMKQAASYPTAAAVLGWGPLGKALKDVGKGFIKHGISELEEINPLLWNRTQGMSSQEIAYAKKSALYKNAPKWMKNISADLIQNVDTATVTTLEYASKYYVDSNFKELQQGSKEYWQKVSEVFTKVVTETQPNYTVLQRPEVLRNPNQLIKQLVMFKTQPLQNFGILYDAWHECNAMRKNLKANNSSDNQAKYKQAKKHLIRAISSQLSAAVTFSAMTIIANLAYHKNWKYDRDDDKDMWQEMLESIGTGVMSTLFGAFTFGDYLYQLIDEKVFGGTYYGLELNTLALFNDTKSGIDKIIDYHDKLSSAENEGAVNKYGLLLGNAYADVIKQACKFFGIPADNIVKTLESIFLYTSEVFNQEEIGSTSMPYDVYKTEGYAKKAYEALLAGDIDAYNELVNDIAKYKTGDNPTQAAKNDVKKVLKQNYTSGKITKEETANILQQYYSMDSEKAALQIYEWENAFSGAYDGIHNVMDKLVKDPDDNSLYNSAREMCNELMANGKDAKDIANNIKSRYKDDYESASTSDRVKIKAAIVKVLNSIGYKTKKYNPSTFVDSWIK